MLFKSGFKYQLQNNETFTTKIYPPKNLHQEFVHLSTDGTLLVKKGFAWDGPSGPTIDSGDFMRGSLAHDALYGLIRNGLLDVKWRGQADRTLYNICRKDGMSMFRAWYVYLGVHFFGKFFLAPDKINKVDE